MTMRAKAFLEYVNKQKGDFVHLLGLDETIKNPINTESGLNLSIEVV